MFVRLQKEVPQFVDSLAKHGISYTYQYQEEANPNSNLGNSISRAYPAANLLSTDDDETKRRKIEGQVKRHSDEWKWGEDGSLSVTHRLSGEFYTPLPLRSKELNFSLARCSDPKTPVFEDSSLLWQPELDVSQSEGSERSRVPIQR